MAMCSRQQRTNHCSETVQNSKNGDLPCDSVGTQSIQCQALDYHAEPACGWGVNLIRYAIRSNMLKFSFLWSMRILQQARAPDQAHAPIVFQHPLLLAHLQDACHRHKQRIQPHPLLNQNSSCNDHLAFIDVIRIHLHSGSAIAHLRVAAPSSTRPRRMSSNSASDSCAGRSRQGLGRRSSLARSRRLCTK